MKHVDVVIIGAGASGMMAAGILGQSGLAVTLMDHAQVIGEKIRVSGGGRCNFTNRQLSGGDGAPYYISAQPRFVRNALSHYTAEDFIQFIEAHGISYHERDHGQLFCDDSAQDIIDALRQECHKGSVTWHIGHPISEISVQNANPATRFRITSHGETWLCQWLIIATGGLAMPAVGATGFGYEVAKQFNHALIPPEAALVPLQFETWKTQGFDALAGLALPVIITTQMGKNIVEFNEALLFRHKGLSGPAILQISSYWQPGQTIRINLCPDKDLAQALCQQKSGQKIQLVNALEQLAPTLSRKLIQHWLIQPEFVAIAKHKWADIPNKTLIKLGNSLNNWVLLPSGHDGHKKAEATRGGVCTRAINPKTLESKNQSGLYFIGEVLDITGWLGGYNFHWAWASGNAAAKAIITQHNPH